MNRRRFALNKPNIWHELQAAIFLLCAFLELRVTSGLGESEFSGGWLTGPLLSTADTGMILFIVSIFATFLLPRIAAAMGLVSSFLSLPLYCFFIAPVPFAHAFAHGPEFKVQPMPGFHWHSWPVTAILTVAVAICVCIRRLVPHGGMQAQGLA
jgi:hypothetical protein